MIENEKEKRERGQVFDWDDTGRLRKADWLEDTQETAEKTPDLATDEHSTKRSTKAKLKATANVSRHGTTTCAGGSSGRGKGLSKGSVGGTARSSNDADGDDGCTGSSIGDDGTFNDNSSNGRNSSNGSTNLSSFASTTMHDTHATDLGATMDRVDIPDGDTTIDAKTVEDLDNDTRTQWRSWLRGMDQSINREKWHNLVTASWCFVLRHPGYPEAQHVSKEDRERQGATWASGGGDDDGRAFTACCDMHGDVFEAAYPRWCATGRLPAGLKGCVVETGLTNCDAQELRRCWSCCPDASVVVGTLVDLLEITGCEKC